MPMKLMLRVRPGEELTCASFCWSRELIRLDLPTLERPRKANSGGPAAGKSCGLVAAIRNLAMGFISKKSTTETRRHGRHGENLAANKCEGTRKKQATGNGQHARADFSAARAAAE